jgi:lipopolysaccharide export system ATP-binding protein
MRKKKDVIPEEKIPEDVNTDNIKDEDTNIENSKIEETNTENPDINNTNFNKTFIDDTDEVKYNYKNIENSDTDKTNVDNTKVEESNIEENNIKNNNVEESNIEIKNIEDTNTKNTNIEIINDTKVEKRIIPENEIHTLGIENLHKKFGKKEVVKGVDFVMQNGEVAGLLGPNGAGKTTIFYMIVGFYTPTQGIVKMDNNNITSLPMYRRARMGIAYLPQEASIFRKLTVEQNIWAILESRRDITKEQKMEKLEDLLSEFNIGRIRDQFGYTLSGGERRRTEIARALATEPKFLLLDEPFAGIDPIAVYDIKQIIRQLADKGIGILITDHNVRDTLEITNEAFIIADGIIFAHGSPDDILNNEKVRKLYLGSEFKMN